MKVGSGDKTTRIVMAYQSSGSNLSTSAGTTVREQHERYFEPWGDLCPAHMIFFEQLIAQLVIWNQTDSDIILLGEHLLRVHCEMSIALGPIINQTMLAM